MISRVLALGATCSMMFALGATPVTAHAQQDGAGAATASTPDLAPIRTALEKLRELKFKRDVPAEQQDLEDFKAFAMAEMEETFPAERFAQVLEGVLRLGLVKERFDLGETVLNALLSQAGGYYNPENGTFYYLMSGLDESAISAIAAHELVHALQDQHFDLKQVTEELEKIAMPEDGPRHDDRVLAVRALIEGEATYVQILWQVKEMMGFDLMANPAQERQALQMQANMDIDQIAQMAQAQMAMTGQEMPEDMMKAMEAMKDIPRYILEPMYAAYFKGAYFSMAMRQANGWEGLSNVYQSMPTSSEQVLHPEKYLTNRDEPTAIELPDLLFVEEAGWSKIDEAVHGEFYLDVMLRTQGVAKPKAAAATAGWDGDIYRAYRNDAGDVFFVFASTWDSEQDAREFADAYAKSLQQKLGVEVAIADDDPRMSYMYTDPFGPAPKKSVNDDGEGDGAVAPPAPPRISGAAPVGPEGEGAQPAGQKARHYGTIIVRGSDVFIAEGFENKGLMEKIIEALAAMTIERID